jgi:hypothetical protein
MTRRHATRAQLHLPRLVICSGLSGHYDFSKMQIVEQTETILQLQDNWYLVYSPSAFTSYIICLNNSNSEGFFVKNRT